LISAHPTALARVPLFEPLRPWLDRLDAGGMPGIDQLNALVGAAPSAPLSGSGAPIRFVVPAACASGYEEAIFLKGEVPTRPGNWHDLFNALVWLAFPHTKAALNARHYRGIQAQRAAGSRSRGALRDAATLFDESGVVVVAANVELSELLRAHQWKDLFWQRRGEVMRSMRFHVIGHAAYDQLRAPFIGLCGKAVFLDADQAFVDAPFDHQLPAIDAQLAARWRGEGWYEHPRELAPLPLLGIPEAWAENGRPAYYDDIRQFRPKRRPR
jgi:DUF3025 family protein